VFDPLFGPMGPPIRLLRGWAAAIPYEMVEGMIPWEQHEVEMYGRRIQRPRMECWYNDDPQRTYTFGGGKPIRPRQMDRVVARVRLRLWEQGYGDFDSCFANRYDSGAHSISWHADDEAWIGPEIASVSFGGVRTFRMRPKKGCAGSPISIELGHGDLLIMLAGCQQTWEHCVPKTRRSVAPRINLTYRYTETTR